MLELPCGPDHDRRLFKLSFPAPIPKIGTHLTKLYLKNKNLIEHKRIGILVSGGIDSAILYYLLTKLNVENNNQFIITPYTILRKEGSKTYALPIINYVQNKFNLPITSLNVVGDNTLPEIQQVESGVKDMFKNGEEYAYLGIIDSREEHSVNWLRWKPVETFNRRYPLLNLQKSHVIDLYKQYNLLDFLELTYSCALNEINACGNCNGCNERKWGLQQVGLPL